MLQQAAEFDLNGEPAKAQNALNALGLLAQNAIKANIGWRRRSRVCAEQAEHDSAQGFRSAARRYRAATQFDYLRLA